MQKIHTKGSNGPGIEFKYVEKFDEKSNKIIIKAEMEIDLNCKTANREYEKSKASPYFVMRKYLKKDI